ncbi:hypothetical protein L0Z65_04740 [Phaeobacter sp. BS52]|uniref:hypothetical protein n=1 Tax=Phaeobacter sp. BS52 TaxID=2907241 RepID=UPI003869FD38
MTLVLIAQTADGLCAVADTRISTSEKTTVDYCSKLACLTVKTHTYLQDGSGYYPQTREFGFAFAADSVLLATNILLTASAVCRNFFSRGMIGTLQLGSVAEVVAKIARDLTLAYNQNTTDKNRKIAEICVFGFCQIGNEFQAHVLSPVVDSSGSRMECHLHRPNSNGVVILGDPTAKQALMEEVQRRIENQSELSITHLVDAVCKNNDINGVGGDIQTLLAGVNEVTMPPTLIVDDTDGSDRRVIFGQDISEFDEYGGFSIGDPEAALPQPFTGDRK